jgi:apoptosis-inducing factor 3
VRSLSPDDKELELESGDRHRYRKLLLACVAWPMQLDVPGTDLERVFTLRTVVDSTDIRAAAGEAERAVVVGGSFIGMEVTASLRTLGLEVTLVHRHLEEVF